jgi:hypothetical protein
VLGQWATLPMDDGRLRFPNHDHAFDGRCGSGRISEASLLLARRLAGMECLYDIETKWKVIGAAYGFAPQGSSRATSSLARSSEYAEIPG